MNELEPDTRDWFWLAAALVAMSLIAAVTLVR